MAVIFLQAVNQTMKRTRTIQGDAGELATSTVTSTATGLVATGAFVDSGRQVQIDLHIQLWQEAIHEIYSLGLFAAEAASATLTLVDGQREYSLPSDFERIAGNDRDERVLRGATTGLLITEYPGGYARMLRDQPIATDYIGDASHWALSPTIKARLRLSAEPTSEQDGQTYNVLYDKRLALTTTMATETLPVSDTVADSLVPVVAEAYNRVMKKEFDSGLFRRSLARGLGYLTQKQNRVRYGRR